METDQIRLFAGSEEIGSWPFDECEIVENGSGFLIRAEQDELPFAPSEPERLRRSLNMVEQAVENGIREAVGSTEAVEHDPGEPPGFVSAPPLDDLAATLETFEPVEQPPPGPVTQALFYLLVAVTLILGLWALYTLI